MNNNIVQMLSRPPINPGRPKNSNSNQVSSNTIPVQPQGFQHYRPAPDQREHPNQLQQQPTNINELQPNNQRTRGHPLRVNSDKKIASNSRTTHSQFSFQINQNNLNAEGLVPNGSWSSGHSTGQFGAVSYSNSNGGQSHVIQPASNGYPSAEQNVSGSNKNTSDLNMQQYYNSASHNNQIHYGFQDQDGSYVTANWHSINNQPSQPVTAQIRTRMADRHTQLANHIKLQKSQKQSNSLNRNYQQARPNEDSNQYRKNQAAQTGNKKQKNGRFISANNRKPRMVQIQNQNNEAASINKLKRLAPRVISQDSRTQQNKSDCDKLVTFDDVSNAEQFAINKDSEQLISLMSNQMASLNNDSSFNEILNYPPEQLKILLELRGGDQLAQIFENVNANQLRKPQFQTAKQTINQPAVNLPLQIQYQNFISDSQKENGTSGQSTPIQQTRQPQLNQAAQKQQLNQYYRQKHKEQQIMEIIQSIKQETNQQNQSIDLRNQVHKSEINQPMGNCLEDQELVGLPSVAQPDDQSPNRGAVKIQDSPQERQTTSQANLNWLASLYQQINQSKPQNELDHSIIINQIQKGIAEAVNEDSSEDSDKKVESMLTMMKQEVEQLKIQKGLVQHQQSKQNNVDTLPSQEDLPFDFHHSNIDTINQQQSPLSNNQQWIRSTSNKTEDAHQGLLLDKNLQINQQVVEQSTSIAKEPIIQRSQQLQMDDRKIQKNTLKPQDSATAILQQQFSKHSSRKAPDLQHLHQNESSPEIQINNYHDHDLTNMATAPKQKDIDLNNQQINFSRSKQIFQLEDARILPNQMEPNQNNSTDRSVSQQQRDLQSNLSSSSKQVQLAKVMPHQTHQITNVQDEDQTINQKNQIKSQQRSQDGVYCQNSIQNQSNKFKRNTQSNYLTESNQLSIERSSCQTDNKLKEPKKEVNNQRVYKNNSNDIIETMTHFSQDKISNESFQKYLNNEKTSQYNPKNVQDSMNMVSVESASKQLNIKQDIDFMQQAVQQPSKPNIRTVGILHQVRYEFSESQLRLKESINQSHLNLQPILVLAVQQNHQSLQQVNPQNKMHNQFTQFNSEFLDIPDQTVAQLELINNSLDSGQNNQQIQQFGFNQIESEYLIKNLDNQINDNQLNEICQYINNKSQQNSQCSLQLDQNLKVLPLK